jgi:arylsulfatase A-like enzyme
MIRSAFAPGVATLLTLFLLGACGASEELSTTRSLLRRAPDLLLEDPGLFLPDPAQGWRGRGLSGWESTTSRGPRDLRCVHSNRLVSRLELTAAGPEERALALEAWLSSDGGDPEREALVEVRINEVTVGTITLRTTPLTLRLDPPATVWTPGRNILELVLAEGALRPGPEKTLRGLALSRVECGERRAVERDRDRGSLVLSSGTGVRYTVEERSRTTIEIEGRCDGAGLLELRFAFLDPVTSRRSGEELPPLRLRSEGGVLLTAIPLPRARDRIVEVELFWEGDGESGSRLTFDRLDLVEFDPPPTPSILFISIDTLSARHMSLLGYSRETTPRLDLLAEESVVFERCSTNAPWTSPSYAALMTGLYPSSASMILGEKQSRFLFTVPGWRWTLAETLQAAGYRTAGFVDAHHIGERFGFAQGFELFDEESADIPHGDRDGGLRHMIPRALQWLDSLESDEPFFCFLHAFDVHGPYLPDEPFAGSFASDSLSDHLSGPEMTRPAGALTHTFGSIPEYIARGPLPEGSVLPERIPVAPLIAAYDEGVLAIDDAVGGFIEELDRRGILDRAIVVFTADHGESIDDHDYFGHGLLYEEVLHVPLLIRLPEEESGATASKERGVRIEQSVQLVDLYPTLTEFAGIASRREDLHGRSLVPLLRGETLPERPTFSEGGSMKQASLELGGWKLIEMHPGTQSLPWTMLSFHGLSREWRKAQVPEAGDGPITREVIESIIEGRDDTDAFLATLRAQLAEPVLELYHLTEDPLESRNLAEQRPDKVKELMRHLRRAQELRERAKRDAEDSRVQLNRRDLDELRKLGYIDDD